MSDTDKTATTRRYRGALYRYGVPDRQMITLRIPRPLLEAVRRQAGKNRLSINEQVLQVLERWSIGGYV